MWRCGVVCVLTVLAARLCLANTRLLEEYTEEEVYSHRYAVWVEGFEGDLHNITTLFCPSAHEAQLFSCDENGFFGNGVWGEFHPAHGPQPSADALREHFVAVNPHLADAIRVERTNKVLHQQAGTGGVEVDAPYNLERLTVARTADTPFNYTYRTSGRGVNVYVLDQGINAGHVDFKYRDGRNGSRVRRPPQYGTVTFPGNSNCQVHGSHVAGIVGGLTYGVAKDAMIYSVQVSPCDRPGDTAYVVSGLQWVLRNVQRPAIVQMSLLVLGTNQLLESKIREVVAANISVVVSAGNYNQDACKFSPARMPEVITVANVDNFDKRNFQSNYGPCITLFAPGTFIPSVPYTGNTGSMVMTGTSQAAPHVTGSVAQLLQRNPALAPAAIKARVIQLAAQNVIDPSTLGASNTPNRVLQIDNSPLPVTPAPGANKPASPAPKQASPTPKPTPKPTPAPTPRPRVMM